MGAGALTTLVASNAADPPLVGGIDSWWRELVSGTRGWLEDVSRGFYVAGLGAVTVPVRLAVAAWLVWKERRADAAAWLAGWAVADTVTWALKPVIGRWRPDGSDMTSFPSGHAKSAAQIGVGLLLLLPRPWRLRAAGPMALWIAGMAVSRTVLDQHWLSDVVAGSLLGAGCALGAVALIRRRLSGRPSRVETLRMSAPMDEERPSCCFDDWASTNAKRARTKETVAGVTGYLLVGLEDAGLEGRSVLDVGCGVGDLALAALAHGAARATGIDLGEGAIEQARALARERGLAERASFEAGDAATAELPVSDVVVLNRVVCCYPSADRLLDNSLGAARSVFAFTAPVDRGFAGLFNRVLVKVSNAWYGLRDARFRGFRTFVHDVDAIDARIRAAGFTPVRRERRRVVWDLAVYTR
jgi:membrane-associated phospholipid phosphatase/SAM-dependent methyltransferase